MNIRYILLFVSLACGSLFVSAQELTSSQVDSLLTPYFSIQEALADDDLDTARQAASRFAENVDEHTQLADSHAQARAIANATDIEVARTAFHRLSQRLQTIVEESGVTEDRQVFVAYCPMAFGYTGAAWMQRDRTIANPYFGDTMLRCGAIQQELGTTGKNQRPNP